MKNRPEPPHPSSLPEAGTNARGGDLLASDPPSPAFLVSFFVVPLVVVSVIVVVGLMFGWRIRGETTPERLVHQLKSNDQASWQSAAMLADLLRNPNNSELKCDAHLANELAGVLGFALDHSDTNSARLRQRIFLCHALGEFQVPQVVPILLRAASQERVPDEVDVRCAAVRALCIYLANNDRPPPEDIEPLVDVLLDASGAGGREGSGSRHRTLRSTAAYALGIVGSGRARDRLAVLIGDLHRNTRYNAATGLARHGDARSIPVLLEMLDWDQPGLSASLNISSPNISSSDSLLPPTALAEEGDPLLVLRNGIRATVQLAQRNPQANMDSLCKALARLACVNQERVPASVRGELAADATIALETIRAVREGGC